MTRNRFFFSIYFFSTIVIFSNLSSCSSNKQKKPEITESFKTHIDQQDNKDFSFQVTMENEGRNTGNRGEGGARGKVGGRIKGEGRGEGRGRGKGEERGENGGMRDKKEKTLKVMNEHLEQLLIKNAYCRSGYSIVDQHSRGRSSIIKGRCNELASAADRENFPNEITPKSIIFEEDLEKIQ